MVGGGGRGCFDSRVVRAWVIFRLMLSMFWRVCEGPIALQIPWYSKHACAGFTYRELILNFKWFKR